MPQKAGIYYSVTGGGQLSCPPVVLVHGAGSNRLCWPAALRRLPGFRVMAIDLPGHGRSDGAARQSIEAYADSLVGFLEGLGIYSSILVGHSMGAAVALQAAVKYPQQVAALGLIAGGAHMDVSTELIEYLATPSMLPLAMEWLRKRLFGQEVSDNLVKQVIDGLGEARQGVLYSDWQACARFEARPHVAGIRAPVWVAAGVEDRLVPLSSAYFLATQAPRAQLQLAPSAGHMVILEQPRPLGEGLSAFLSTHFH